jgi:hypothetical protein
VSLRTLKAIVLYYARNNERLVNEQPGNNGKERKVPRPQMKREDDKERQHGNEREDWGFDACPPCRWRGENEESGSPGVEIPGEGSG